MYEPDRWPCFHDNLILHHEVEVDGFRQHRMLRSKRNNCFCHTLSPLICGRYSR